MVMVLPFMTINGDITFHQAGYIKEIMAKFGLVHQRTPDIQERNAEQTLILTPVCSYIRECYVNRRIFGFTWIQTSDMKAEIMTKSIRQPHNAQQKYRVTRHTA